ncbi:PREDICTED: uncharacterized protein LOC108561077 [Nicrophorus vespilloides]|uniref:Uncharacterized protein LOC108561077 n=1 Tax=Nicrophorus vespilloides TaxID=110193 RepID=A0ABM1MIF3_NICVS|nr:PREDICTED: uncharacterized protein LOC108561077 [Nicrophorus vespilloides]
MKKFLLFDPLQKPPKEFRTMRIFSTSTSLAGLTIMIRTFKILGWMVCMLMISWICYLHDNDFPDTKTNEDTIDKYINQLTANLPAISADVRSYIDLFLTLLSLLVTIVGFINFCGNLIRTPYTMIDWLFYTITNIIYLMFFASLLKHCEQFQEDGPLPQCSSMLLEGTKNNLVLSICSWHQTMSFALIHFVIFAYSREKPLYISIRKFMSDKRLREKGLEDVAF